MSHLKYQQQILQNQTQFKLVQSKDKQKQTEQRNVHQKFFFPSSFLPFLSTQDVTASTAAAWEPNLSANTNLKVFLLKEHEGLHQTKKNTFNLQ